MTKKGSRLIAILVAVVMSAAFLLSCVSVFGVFLQDDNIKPQAANVYISSFSDFEIFMKNVAGGNTYEDQTVVLTTDIDCYGAEFPPIGTKTMSESSAMKAIAFAGIFDGQGHKIHNYTIVPYIPNCQTASDNAYDIGIGLFAKTYRYKGFAQINNLWLDNFKVRIKQDSVTSLSYGNENVRLYIGALVGYAQSLNVSNCKISNFQINNTNYNEGWGDYYTTLKAISGYDISIGCVTGYGGIIENCEIVTTTAVSWVDDNMRYFWFGEVFPSYQTASASNVVYAVNYDVEKHVNVDVTTVESATIRERNTTTGLSFDGELIVGNSDKTWFYRQGFNDGWPTLRQFLSEINLTFESNNTEWGTVSVNDITCLSVINTVVWYDSSREFKLGDYVACVANPYDNFEFQSWSQQGSQTFQAIFYQKTCSLTFKYDITLPGNLTNYTMRYEWGEDDRIVGGENEHEDFVYNVESGTKISCEVQYNKYETIITYEWEDRNYGWYRRRLKYVIPNIYQLGSSSLLGNETKCDVVSNMTITPIIKLKSYNITFG